MIEPDEERKASQGALADLLSVAAAHGMVAPEDDAAAIRRHGLLPREDSPHDEAKPDAFVDCAARMPICQAVCCKLAIHLSTEEAADGRLRRASDRPYLLAREADGRCTHQDRDSGFCGVYEDRPGPCRRYSCAGDRRIWRDFDGMLLNQEWIDANLGGSGGLQLIQLQPLARKE